MLGVYGEELVNGARAAIFGNATLGLAEELALRGARLVHVFDPSASRVAEASARSHDRSIFYAPLPDGGDVGVRDGAFDFVLVPDLSIFTDPISVIALVRRVVSRYGAAIVASPNVEVRTPLLRVAEGRSKLGYYELYEAVAAHFAKVRMIGQAPFVGYTVAELSVEDPDPTIDSSLAEGESREPEWFLALASDRPVKVDPFALIELPAHFFATRGDARDALPLVANDAPAATGSGTVLINILEAEREAALESLRQQEQAIEAERFRAQQAAQELSSARDELGLLRERCRTLEERVSQEEKRRLLVEAELEKPNAEVQSLRERAKKAEAAGRQEVRVVEERAKEHVRDFEERAKEQVRLAEERAKETKEQIRLADERVKEARAQARAAEERAKEQVRSAEDRAKELARAAEERARELARAAEERVREQLRLAEERAQRLESSTQGLGAEHEGEVARLEAQLRDRGREIQDLRGEVQRRDKVARELIMTNFPPLPYENGIGDIRHDTVPSTARSEDADRRAAELATKLDRLANDAARREADLVSAKWKIAQLERELAPQR